MSSYLSSLFFVMPHVLIAVQPWVNVNQTKNTKTRKTKEIGKEGAFGWGKLHYKQLINLLYIMLTYSLYTYSGEEQHIKLWDMFPFFLRGYIYNF